MRTTSPSLSLLGALVLLVFCSGAGFGEHYDVLESTVRGVGSDFKEGDRGSLEHALERLRHMRERLREEWAEEEHSSGRLQRVRKDLEPATRKEAEPLVQKAQSINRANIKRLSELIKLSETEIRRLERRQSAVKPEGLDSGDFRLLPPPQSQ